MQIFLNTIGTSWIIPGLSKIFLFFDAIVYAILEGAVNIFFIVGSMNTSSLQEALSTVISNANTLVGIYILFKLSLVFIQYLVEPEKFKDKAQGGSALVKNVVIVIILLILLKSNVLFGIFNDIQKIVFNTAGENTQLQVLDKLGVKLTSHDMISMIVYGEEVESQPGHKIAVKLLESFLFVDADPGDAVVKQAWDPSLAGPNIFDPAAIFGTVAASQIGGVSFFYLMTVGNIFANTLNVTYTAIISTVFGVYMIIKFFKYALQLIIRFMKLILMQILSPIAIVSYITPSGKATFKNFWKTYFTIYLELFIRLLVAYLSIYMMSLVLNNSSNLFDVQNDFITQLVLDIMVLSAISKFMDEMPNIIASLFGGKLDDKQKSIGGILGGVLGGGIGAAIGIGAARAAGAGTGGSLLGGAMGMLGGVKSGANSQNFGAFVSGQVSNATRATGRGMNIGNAGGGRDYLRMQADNTFGGANAIKKEDKNLTKALEHAQKDHEWAQKDVQLTKAIEDAAFNDQLKNTYNGAETLDAACAQDATWNFNNAILNSDTATQTAKHQAAINMAKTKQNIKNTIESKASQSLSAGIYAKNSDTSKAIEARNQAAQNYTSQSGNAVASYGSHINISFQNKRAEYESNKQFTNVVKAQNDKKAYEDQQRVKNVIGK